MQIDDFMPHLKEFIRKHGLTEDLPSRWRKLQGEVNELEEAIIEGDKAEIIKEACDVAIIAFHIMMVAGAANPIWHMFLKLEEVAKRPKYQAIVDRLKQKEAE